MSTKAKTYDPLTVEPQRYQFWLDNGYFNADPDPNRKPYSIVIPPPNVTGILHMGHILNNTIQDILIRRKRMEGYNACWVPGMDHASIATEAKVVANLREQGIKKSELSREAFLAYAWEWKEKYGGIILKQLQRMGASCDWRRTRFTMDAPLSAAVIDAFVQLYNEGYVYKGLRMTNWDPQAKTAVSDEEVLHKETNGKLYHLRYPLQDQPGQFIIIATTRPETILADAAVAVHPEDERYQHLVGKHALLPLLNRPLPIIADAYVDPAFGTGCLKVTPAHDMNDYEIGKRHNLTIIDILNEDGSLNETAQLFVGQDRFEVRKLIIQQLQAEGFVEKIEDNLHNVGYSERTNAVIEPRLTQQWFVRMGELAKPALAAVVNPASDDSAVHLIPNRYLNTYKHWMEDCRDWCISRQLWWGQQIPVYYYRVNEEDHYAVASNREAAYAIAQSNGYTGSIDQMCQDPDVLDTWFSSWLWPITVFDGWGDEPSDDFHYFYPTNDLVTAPEILFFWVARMIIAGTHFKQQRPFQNVYLTGIVRDKLGRKMSKSLGNSPDALMLLDQYGADGVRLGLMLCSAAGNDLMFDESLCAQGRNFSNKLWNAYRLMDGWSARLIDQAVCLSDQQALDWMRARLETHKVELAHQFEQYRIADAAMGLYKIVWDDFCSWFLELIKPGFEEPLTRQTFEQSILLLEEILQLLHPFIPFITEELWHELRPRTVEEALIISRLAPAKPEERHARLTTEMEQVRQLVTELRSFKAQFNLSPKKSLQVYVKTQSPALFETYNLLLEKMAVIEPIQLVAEPVAQTSMIVVGTHELYIQLEADLVDTEAQKAKLVEEQSYLQGFLQSVQAKLSNENFVARAKPEVIQKETQKKQDAEARLAVIASALVNLN
jgi:valyl-tRNA synthetase